MIELIEYLIAVGGSLVVFYATKTTNWGVRHFTGYMCILVAWSIVMFTILYFLHKGKAEKK